MAAVPMTANLEQGVDVRVFVAKDHAQAQELWESTEALASAGIQKCHLLVFHDNAAGRAFWERIGAERRTTLEIFSLPT